jgi:hypothetical protein
MGRLKIDETSDGQIISVSQVVVQSELASSVAPPVDRIFCQTLGLVSNLYSTTRREVGDVWL